LHGDLDPHRARAFALIPFRHHRPDIFGSEVGLYGLDAGTSCSILLAFGAIAFYTGSCSAAWRAARILRFLGDARRRAADLLRVAMGLSLFRLLMTRDASLTGIVERSTACGTFVPPPVRRIPDLPRRRFAETTARRSTCPP